MLALSLSQPWLWSIEHAGKRIENRSWPPPISVIGRRIALHAAKSWDHRGVSSLFEMLKDKPEILSEMPNTRERFASGVITSTVVIDRVVTTARTLDPDQVVFFFGAYGWLLTDLKRLTRPVTCPPGQFHQKLWRLTPEQVADVAAAGGI